ncbi:MAG: carboxypeptidase regulatory-like domain-containing protein [Algicola sp.]|nr:carboxypeptidase regulatory-like domain-containing protein [Algicola sp.]
MEISVAGRAGYWADEDTTYTLTIETELGEYPGYLTGFVTQFDGTPVAQATLHSSFDLSTVTFADGGYFTSHPTGSYELDLTFEGKNYNESFLIAEQATTELNLIVCGEAADMPTMQAPQVMTKLGWRPTHLNWLPILHRQRRQMPMAMYCK